jgi:hypothetical protein
MTERGCFNHRWPFNEYALLNKNEQEVGFCSLFSCVKDGILYQVLRLRGGGPPKLSAGFPNEDDVKVTLTVGGPLRFRCMCSRVAPVRRAKLEVSNDATMVYAKHGPMQLDMQVYRFRQDISSQSYETLPLNHLIHEDDGDGEDQISCSCSSYRTEIPFNSKHREVIVVAAFHLRGSSKTNGSLEPPSSQEFYKYLGLDPSEGNAPTAMWRLIFLEREQETYSSSELSEVRLVARCLERILHVDLVSTKVNNGELERDSVAVVSNVFLRGRLDLKAFL